ncbi:uncharacterized protein LOC129318355 [Prosopis cineraria]|uniref:uncharacterized protein LOC129318355 n=1 Tax=Prosopis cineraria TaxID=364024 RepID=UPI0024102313|nr:uncharacterized protein LOC129318355 [Prosopis cineraria]
MAVEELESPGRKRKRGSGKRKLVVNDRVEVRSIEDGFLGSWHPGTVIQCGKQKRHVRYDNVLDDNGSNYLVDVVDVPAILDGASSTIYNERGFIRPPPPSKEFGKWDLPFGLCVDVHYQEAWWEGVIFDHCDGMEERSIFFPDLGDEMKIKIDHLRVTHDWSEVTEEWERRGMWVFLELVEECEQDTYVAVSVKQIWYDVRAKEDFDKIRDWTCNVKDLWRDLVLEVINDYFALTLREVFTVFDISKDLLTVALEPESAAPTADIHINPEKNTDNFQSVLNSDNQLNSKSNVLYDAGPSDAFVRDISLAEKHSENDELSDFLDADQNSGSVFLIQEKYDSQTLRGGVSNAPVVADLDMSFLEKEVLVQKESISPVEEILADIPEGISGQDAGTAGEVNYGAGCYKRNRQLGSSTCRRLTDWNPLILSEVELCPDSIHRYALASNRKSREQLKTNVRKHIAYLGWKIEWMQHANGFYQQTQYRYTSPEKEGKQVVYKSLRKVCEHIEKDTNTNSLLSQDDQRRMHPTTGSNISHNAILPSPSIEDAVEPEFCPEAVLRYYLLPLKKGLGDVKKIMIPKARKHLLAEGWNFEYPTIRGRGITYISPQNVRFGSLRVACGACIKVCLPQWISSGTMSLDGLGINEETMNPVDSDKLLYYVSQLLQKEPELADLSGVPESRSTGHCKLKPSRNVKPRPPKLQKKGLPIRLQRSSKRVQKVCAPCPSHQKAQNVLSWLIDCKGLLPRSKVQYRARGTGHPMAEGRITRDGIKCSCCRKLYSLSGFEGHATGSRNCRSAAANIILENGKSLLDFQMKIMNEHRARGTIKTPSKSVYQEENDAICSVCHYGGELILCDNCPSSFHKSCLGLEDIPDGDWFCPSCCCGICQQSKTDGADDENLLTCSQCEHKYHANCLGKRPVAMSGRYLKNWFCGKSCEKLYAGLHKLLGEPVAVGVNNLNWTLLKYVNSENCDLGNGRSSLEVESYSKLNVALSVMHECFEPLKESYSGRDLMEDVIFSRWSKLNRLNFQGFYTVLLERNEEVITVATVRVYGEKVAEVPLVGTRFQYRRLGMCRILMDELEKRLMLLGVERIVLPAVPSVLETWTTSFGFAQMTNSERSQFLDYTFLDFQDTIMCQKLLTKTRPALVLSTESHPNPHDVLSVSGGTGFDQSSAVSELCQAEENDKSETLDLQMVDPFAGSEDRLGNGAPCPVHLAKPVNSEGEQLQNRSITECSLEDGHLKQVSTYNAPCKYYKRRKNHGRMRILS